MTLLNVLNFGLYFLSDLRLNVMNNISHLVLKIRGIIHNSTSSAIEQLNLFKFSDDSFKTVIPDLLFFVKDFENFFLDISHLTRVQKQSFSSDLSCFL